MTGSCVLRETILKGRPWLVRAFLYLSIYLSISPIYRSIDLSVRGGAPSTSLSRVARMRYDAARRAAVLHGSATR